MMAAPRFTRYVTALDVGSSKVAALIAGIDADGGVHVLGSSHRESAGVRRSYVVDIDKTERVVRDTIEQAERIAGLNNDDVWASFSGGQLACRNLPIECDVGGQRIEVADVDDLLAAARHSIDSEGRMVLHAQPAMFTLDGLTGVRSPIGLFADRLTVDINIVLADGGPVRNLASAVTAAHLKLRTVVAAPLATGMACLSEEERELGVALVDLGASVTSVAFFAGGLLVDLELLPVGSADITDDIASAFGVSRAHAQRAQSFHGSALATPRDNNDPIDVAPPAADGTAGPRVTRAQLIAVIGQRLDQIFGEVGRALKVRDFGGRVGRQVVLTGGGADLKGIAEYAQVALGQPVRRGLPSGLIGLPPAHSGPAFATLAGLALYAAADPVDLRDMALDSQTVLRPASGSVWQRLVLALRGSQ